jgi:glycosyltransferase involved in cell wall biosynthesis
VGRLDRAKRIDLLIEAASRQGVDVVISGEGPDRERLEGLANGRVRFTGRVSEAELADLYARCRAVFYAPVDEDFGMVPFEAFLAEKPVVTTTDAGGPLDVVRDRETGRVVEPTVESVAGALAIGEEDARNWGRAGKALAERVTWDSAIDRLLT